MNSWIAVLIVIVSEAVAFAVSPADPVSHILAFVPIVAVGLSAYWLGTRKKRAKSDASRIETKVD
jgi:hypothetical protein